MQKLSSKLQIVRFHAKNILDRIAYAKENLDRMLDDLTKDLEIDVATHRHVSTTKSLAVEFRDHVLIAHLEGFLTQIKSLLDSLTQFYAIAFNRKVKAFSDNGNRVINDMNNLGNRHAVRSKAMIELIITSKLAWIDGVIGYRDEIVHFGELGKFKCLHLLLNSTTKYSSSDVIDSLMPNKQPTTDYTHSILERIHRFSADWLTIVFAELRENGMSASKVDGT